MSHGEGPAGTHRSAQHSDARLQLSRGTPGCCFNARIEGKDHQYWGQRCSRFVEQSVGWQATSALLERVGSFETCATTVSPVPFASSIRGIFYPRQFEPSSRSNASGRQSIISGLRTRLWSFIATVLSPVWLEQVKATADRKASPVRSVVSCHVTVT